MKTIIAVHFSAVRLMTAASGASAVPASPAPSRAGRRDIHHQAASSAEMEKAAEVKRAEKAFVCRERRGSRREFAMRLIRRT